MGTAMVTGAAPKHIQPGLATLPLDGLKGPEGEMGWGEGREKKRKQKSASLGKSKTLSF